MTADAGMEQNQAITKEALEVYDRQIRLWGLEAQNKLRSSNVLLAGLSPLGAEITKNLMLCGIGSLTIADNKTVEEDDIVSNFLLQDDSKINRAIASSTKAKLLNPMVEFKTVTKSIHNFDEDDLKKYDLIILIDEPYDTVKQYDEFCRQHHIRFMAGSIFGWYGYSFFDFDKHNFLTVKTNIPELDLEDENGSDQKNTATVIEEDILEMQQLSYPSFETTFNFNWNQKKYLRKVKRLVPPSYVCIRAILRAQQENIDLSSNEMARIFNEERDKINLTTHVPDWKEEDSMIIVGPQMSPVAAIVGGMMGQEAIRALSEGQSPLRNLFIYSAIHTAGHMLNYPPE